MRKEDRLKEKLYLFLENRSCPNVFCKCAYNAPFQIVNGKIICNDLQSILNWVGDLETTSLQEGCLLKEIKELVQELINEKAKKNGK